MNLPRTPRASLPLYIAPSAPQRRRGRVMAAIVAAAIITAAVIVAAIAIAVARATPSLPSLPPVPTAPTTLARPPSLDSPRAPAAVPPGTGEPAASPSAARLRSSASSAAPANARLGIDYSWLGNVTVGGRPVPVHWPCTTAITVTLAPGAPPGAAPALTALVTQLRQVSHLPLRLDATAAPDARTGLTPGAITVTYGPLGARARAVHDHGLTSPDILGVGGAQYDPATGVIDAGDVLIRNDTPHTDPRTPEGQTTLLHELLHTLGLGHARHGRHEVMEPYSDTSTAPILGAGDRYALTVLGCHSQP